MKKLTKEWFRKLTYCAEKFKELENVAKEVVDKNEKMFSKYPRLELLEEMLYGEIIKVYKKGKDCVVIRGEEREVTIQNVRIIKDEGILSRRTGMKMVGYELYDEELNFIFQDLDHNYSYLDLMVDK